MENPIRLLVVARQPLRLEDLGLESDRDFGETQLIRRPEALAVAMEELRPNLIIIDVAFPEGRRRVHMGSGEPARTHRSLPGFEAAPVKTPLPFQFQSGAPTSPLAPTRVS